MFLSLKKFLVYFGLTVSVLIPTPGFCTIWDDVSASIIMCKSPALYEEIIKNIGLLTEKKNINIDSEGNYIIAAGLIVISPDGIRSYKKTDQGHITVNPNGTLSYVREADIEPEFTFPFSKNTTLTVASPSIKKDTDGDYEVIGENMGENTEKNSAGARSSSTEIETANNTAKKDATPTAGSSAVEDGYVLVPIEGEKTKGLAVETKKSLTEIRVALDIIPVHQYLKEQRFGGCNYEEFVRKLQEKLKETLESKGIMVSLVRPAHQMKDASDAINKNPPHLFISTQFNNDHQDSMVTFFCGNILSSEFTNERQRARFIQSALTNKHVHSAQLASCMAQTCKDRLQVDLMSGKNAFFKSDSGIANAQPVPEDMNFICPLEKNEGYYSGIAGRNLFLNGIFSKAGVIVFPDIQWVQKKIENEMEWIENYVNALVEGVSLYVIENPSLFTVDGY